MGISFKKVKTITVQAPAGTMSPAQIMKKFRATGVNTVAVAFSKEFGRADMGADLLDSLQKVRDAEYAFAQLPAKVRDRFGNDPVELFSFLENENNRKEAEDLGLIEKVMPVVKEPVVEVPVVKEPVEVA